MTPEPAGVKDFHDELMAILKRRGFIQPSYEIYGGVAGFFDYGPLGAGLKRNLQDLWRRFYVVEEGMAEIECPNVSPEQVFRASGHLEKFADTVVECPACGNGMRGDHLVKGEFKRFQDEVEKATHAKDAKKALNRSFAEKVVQWLEAARESADKDPSPANLRRILQGPTPPAFYRDETGHAEFHDGTLGIHTQVVRLDLAVACFGCQKPLDVKAAKIDAFNLMFRTQVGPGSGRVAYLRPETAQGMFMDFPWLLRYFRDQLPFGAVQLGRAYRNEISPRQSLLRLREFSQMEAEVFFDPAAKAWPGARKWEDVTLTLLARETSNTVEMKAGEAVAKGIVANGALGYFLALTQEFLLAAGLRRDRLRFRQHEATEKAHYSTDTWDAEFWSPRFGWVEIVGIADRTDYDLKAHEHVSGQSLVARRRLAEPREVAFREHAPDFKRFGPLYKAKAQAVGEALKATPVKGDGKAPVTVHVDGESVVVPPELFTVREGTRREEFEEFVPHVVEPSYGVDRCFYAILESAWHEGEWVTLRLASAVAPVKVGVFPLMPKDGLDVEAQRIDRALRAQGLVTTYDDTGSIGKRYARADEAGVPFGVTVDYDTLKDGTVTVRDRDSASQVRVAVAGLPGVLADLLAGKAKLADLAAGGRSIA